MRWSKTFIPTLRDDPADAESPSHRLLTRAAFVRQLAPGIFSYLPLGQRTILKIVGIVRDELNEAGAQEFQLPVLNPADLWQKTGRWADLGESVFRMRDRAGREMCLGISCEETFADIVGREIRSYKDLPQAWYEIQTRFHDVARPRSGLLSLRQVITMEALSLNIDTRGLGVSHQAFHNAFEKIYSRCGLNNISCTADQVAVVARTASESELWSRSGLRPEVDLFSDYPTGSDSDHENAGGGIFSERFMVPMESDEDTLVSCECGYTANIEAARSRAPAITDTSCTAGPHEVHTPERKTISEIADFLHVSPMHQIKSLIYMVNGQPHMFLVRGDHQLNETKVIAALDTRDVRAAQPQEILEALGAGTGSLGPVGVSHLPLYADIDLQGRRNLTCGANKDDYHLQGVDPGVHFMPEWADLRMVEKGDLCARCSRPLEFLQAAEVGRITGFGTKLSEQMGAAILNAAGRQVPVVMGSGRIGIDRIMVSVVETSHDSEGIVWPVSIAPFSVIITPIVYKDEIRAEADRLYTELKRAGIDTLLDDRAERPGVKFKDADLVGIPFRVVLGAEKLRQGKAELYDRARKKAELVELSSLIAALAEKIKRQSTVDS